jgi:hypothetical protein
MNTSNGTNLANENKSNVNVNRNNTHEHGAEGNYNSNFQSKLDKESEGCLDLNKRINIKLNINSEVINNNIKINHKSIEDGLNIMQEFPDGITDSVNADNMVSYCIFNINFNIISTF